jgi:hypothetical protein
MAYYPFNGSKVSQQGVRLMFQALKTHTENASNAASKFASLSPSTWASKHCVPFMSLSPEIIRISRKPIAGIAEYSVLIIFAFQT